MAPSVWVTRPAREASRWVDALRRGGIAAQAFPLIEIAPAPDPAALAQCRAALAQFDAVMFVSAHAVQGLLPAPGLWPATGPRAWATGAGTAAALRAAGVPGDHIDVPGADAPQFDSEALWPLVSAQVAPGAQVLVVRGADAQGQTSGRPWLVEQLRQRGAAVTEVASYSRRAPALDTQQLARAGDAAAGWWLFSSSEAVANLVAAGPGTDRASWRALCTHPRIAQAARLAGFGEVAQVRPTVEAVLAFLQSQP
ncbi:uroporphyrinogen-III synthase [Ramlibacter aurantiacus]|uniref:uroporphyrinogen-III synthase n=1 Tax=Ramlibacter aurantiacus TaxID=2801330 RepID=UPI003F498277